MRLSAPPDALHPVRPPTSAAAFDATRPEVRRLLTAIPSFLDLPDDERRRIAADTVRVLAYLADPNGVHAEIAEREANGELPPTGLARPIAPPHPVPAATALADDPVTATKRQLAQDPGFAGKDFQAGAVKQGVEQFGQMVQKVDFPKFVGGLIKNVFQAIVESSIEQMRAYGELIANVAKTTGQFMSDNISEGAGRDYLADSFPDVLSVQAQDGAGAFDADSAGAAAAAAPSRLVAQGDDAQQRLAEISRTYNLDPPVTDLSDDKSELRLVTAARLQMAKQRQQLLSSMVMLGINRIVVTDGSINAKVVFDMRASDTAKRTYTASMHDRESQKYKESVNAHYGSWYTPYSADAAFEGQQEHVATVGSALDDTSESRAEVKAKLSGEVRVNFKSDYLPLDKMATPEMMSVIQGNSTPYNPNKPAPAAGLPAGQH
ncbi:hypothetical protein BamIOP4010DRAFT_6587 [Burkholderia ambifaria IOP40-10]|jgi:hypothetical protein|uniref:Uncharacterized protein n=1 Tax=Burkholderia ambifaria IOP40-10 TaxID=396596 RepID=B1FRC6_9BURK|nr:hypothetical protein [Burkholderia ambifaria]EDS99895.1 hypothetical protein BamIOP4010DRAFT_6587 [Burkholderia ambifaria IOP40-10]